MHLAKTFLLEVCIAHSKNFIHDENIWFKMCGHGEGQAHIHSRRISFDRCIKKLFNSGKVYDLIKLPLDLMSLHSEKISVEVDILTSRQLVVKSCPYFEKAVDAPPSADTSVGRTNNIRENF